MTALECIAEMTGFYAGKMGRGKYTRKHVTSLLADGPVYLFTPSLPPKISRILSP